MRAARICINTFQIEQCPPFFYWLKCLYAIPQHSCKSFFNPKLRLVKNKPKSTTRTPRIQISEMLTIMLLFQQSPCIWFKYFYLDYLPTHHPQAFHLVSYSRFIQLMPRVLPYMVLLMQWYTYQVKMTGISFIDATSLAVCHQKRIKRNKVFRGIAKLGKTTKGWFYGLKLHMIINERGEILNIKITPGNTDDRAHVTTMTRRLTGLLFGDKGYIKRKLFETLYSKGLKLVTGIKKNMKNKLMILREKSLLKKRSIIDTVFSVLKGSHRIEHSRHRSIWNAFVHIFAALISYSIKASKPSIREQFLIQN